MLSKHPTRWMIWEGEPLPESVEKLKSIGISSLVFNPCGNKPDKGDFLIVIQNNIQNLKLAYQ